MTTWTWHGHASPVDSPHKRPVMRSFDDFFILCLNKFLNKQLRCWWFKTPWRSCDVTVMSDHPCTTNRKPSHAAIQVTDRLTLFVVTWWYACRPMALTHWGRDEMNNISQTTFSNVFSSMKMYEFRLKFHWSLFPSVQLSIFQHWFR